MNSAGKIGLSSILIAGALGLVSLAGCLDARSTAAGPAAAGRGASDDGPSSSDKQGTQVNGDETMSDSEKDDQNLRTATFGAGCFWCVEAVFQQLDGVVSVESGYTGGSVPHPTYQQVCSGQTGHAEVCRIRFDPERIGFEELLEVFWTTHDPTTLNRQGHDVGTQYRSAIFYHDDTQKELAEKYKKKLNESGTWTNPIVTEIVPVSKYYKAEDYHQNYYELNGNSNPYCQVTITPKIDKVRKVFKDKLKTP